MKSKGRKKKNSNELKKDLAEAKNLIVAQFQGITVRRTRTCVRRFARRTASIAS